MPDVPVVHRIERGDDGVAHRVVDLRDEALVAVVDEHRNPVERHHGVLAGGERHDLRADGGRDGGVDADRGIAPVEVDVRGPAVREPQDSRCAR